jgi:hypothetical protein
MIKFPCVLKGILIDAGQAVKMNDDLAQRSHQNRAPVFANSGEILTTPSTSSGRVKLLFKIALCNASRRR